MHLVKYYHIKIINEITVIYYALICTNSNMANLFPFSKIRSYVLFGYAISNKSLDILLY